MRIRSFLAFVISFCITFAFVPAETFAFSERGNAQFTDVVNTGKAFPVLTTSVNCAFPLSENANVSAGTKAKVIQNEITKAKKERILIIKVAVKFCD